MEDISKSQAAVRNRNIAGGILNGEDRPGRLSTIGERDTRRRKIRVRGAGLFGMIKPVKDVGRGFSNDLHRPHRVRIREQLFTRRFPPPTGAMEDHPAVDRTLHDRAIGKAVFHLPREKEEGEKQDQ